MESSLIVNKKGKPNSRDEWEKLDKSALIDHIISLQTRNIQLQNLLQKNLQQQSGGSNTNLKDSQKKNDRKREFDFSKTHKRHILLKFLYFGWDYQGLATQADLNKTIEYHLFEALTRACLIESRETCNYQRCGRTDKTVSAFCQVISIDLRSKFKPDKQLTPESIANELDYLKILNSILPENIRCITWMPLRSSTYSARFDCLSRTYRYYFPRGNLNVEAMRDACKLLERHADFRNFCKMDVHNGVTNFMRHIKSANIEKINNNEVNNLGYEMYFLEIKANAFLMHQIRCIMMILLLIGQGKEETTVVDELLDIEKNPCKPQYGLASGIPLNLFKCEFKTFSESDLNSSPRDNQTDFETDTTKWIYKQDNMIELIKVLQAQWTLHSIKTTMIRNVLDELSATLTNEFKIQEIQYQIQILEGVNIPKRYQKLMDRKRCKSLESRVDHFVKKQRLIVSHKNAKEI